MSSKVTAVEWLVQEINQMINVIPMEKWDVIRDIVQEAKAMEKAQMIKFANDFLFHDDTDLTAEQYYQQNFGL